MNVWMIEWMGVWLDAWMISRMYRVLNGYMCDGEHSDVRIISWMHGWLNGCLDG
jgi:hypothetical protein